MLDMILAATREGIIGYGNSMPWHSANDFAFFKMMTLHGTVIMGNNTFKGIVASVGKPLPKRDHLVITRQPQDPSLVQYKNVAYTDDFYITPTFHRYSCWICGGAQVYEYYLKNYRNCIANIYLTEVGCSIPPPKNGERVLSLIHI